MFMLQPNGYSCRYSVPIFDELAPDNHTTPQLMPRKKIVAANWKMNLTEVQASALIDDMLQGLPSPPKAEVVMAVPYVYLPLAVARCAGTPVKPAAQNCYYEAWGAYTGEISVGMLESLGVTYCITGHSERRQIFSETSDVVRKKTEAILHAGLTPIFCCGESLETRDNNTHTAFVRGQLEESLFHLDPRDFSRVVIAYEPIWAIGTGRQASPLQAQEMHAFIREQIIKQYGAETGEAMPILYGGSLKADNAGALFSQPDVDGGLVGGASLEAASFLSIIRSAC